MTTELEELRAKITETDNDIIEALELRMKLAEEVAEFKRENDISIEDKTRESQIINDRKLQTSLNEQFVEDIFKLIFKESKRVQNGN